MATITKGYTFGTTETVTAAKLHSLVDSATITNIVNADVSASAAIEGSKIDLGALDYLTTGTPAPVLTGVWDFTALTDINNLIGSLACISDIRTNNIYSANITSSLASISAIRAVNLNIASLCSVNSITVTNINGSAYSAPSSFSVLDYETSLTTGTQRGTAGATLKIAYGTASLTGSDNITNLPFTSADSYTAIAVRQSGAGYASQAITVNKVSGSTLNIMDFTTGAKCNWFCIGI